MKTASHPPSTVSLSSQPTYRTTGNVRSNGLSLGIESSRRPTAAYTILGHSLCLLPSKALENLGTFHPFCTV